eukprot:Gb_23594 [translate_table: standard]
MGGVCHDVKMWRSIMSSYLGKEVAVMVTTRRESERGSSQGSNEQLGEVGMHEQRQTGIEVTPQPGSHPQILKQWAYFSSIDIRNNIKCHTISQGLDCESKHVATRLSQVHDLDWNTNEESCFVKHPDGSRKFQGSNT